MESSTSTWDFDAPGFIDFGANEHEVAVGRDSYFDYDHELLRGEGLPKEDYRPMELLKESSLQAGRRLTFDTPTRANSTPRVVSNLNNVKENKDCETPHNEEIPFAIETKNDKVTSAIETSEIPISPRSTNIEEGENTSNDLPKDFAECAIGSCIPAKPSTKADRSVRRKNLRRSRRLPKAADATKNDQPPAKKKCQLTQVSTPTVLKRQGSSLSSVTKMKSTAEIELVEVERLKREQKRRLKENTKSLKLALAGPARPPSPAKFPKSKAEYKPRHEVESANSAKLSSEIDFSKKLRQYRSCKSPPKMTRVQPFHFATRKRKFDEGLHAKNKPYRFNECAKPHTNFQIRQMKRVPGSKKEPMKAFTSITDAKTPKLLTKTRSRTVHVIGIKEKEEMELEEIRKNNFKAKPVDSKILKGPTVLPEVEKRDVTHPEEFHLHLDKRIKERPVPEKGTSPNREFKANPIPKSFYEGPTNIVKKHLATTVAQSPNFQLKKRMEVSHAKRELKAIEEKENLHMPAVVTKAPAHKVEKKPALPEKHCTQLQPFSFDKSDKERFSNKEARIEAIHEAIKQKASTFRAQPIISQPNPLEALPPKNAKRPTKAQPFHLESDSRGQARAENWKAQLKKEEEMSKSKTEFKANMEYQKILSKCGFKPVLTERQNCDFEEFDLHTASRATERQHFDEKIKHKEGLILQRAKDREMEAERQAEEEARKQRKEAEHKAAPIRKYAPVIIKESDKLPTVPHSPKFSTRFYNGLNLP